MPQSRMQRIGPACFLPVDPRTALVGSPSSASRPNEFTARGERPSICYPSVHYAGTPISDQAQITDSARIPPPSEPATA